MAMYKSLAQNPMEKLQYDQGEDRWLCTLMLFSGGRIEYEGFKKNNNFPRPQMDLLILRVERGPISDFPTLRFCRTKPSLDLLEPKSL